MYSITFFLYTYTVSLHSVYCFVYCCQEMYTYKNNISKKTPVCHFQAILTPYYGIRNLKSFLTCCTACVPPGIRNRAAPLVPAVISAPHFTRPIAAVNERS